MRPAVGREKWALGQHICGALVAIAQFHERLSPGLHARRMMDLYEKQVPV